MMKLKNILPTILTLLFFFETKAQNSTTTISGITKDLSSKNSIPYANLILKSTKDQKNLFGTVSNEEGRFEFTNISPGNYTLETSATGYKTIQQKLFVGILSEFLDLKTIYLEEDINILDEVTIVSKTQEINSKMNKKTYDLDDNLSQSGGSVLQSMQNLPGITAQDGKVQLRGNDKVLVLIDGKQTALTGFGNQSGLDNIPASAIERIEIINNPSAKYEANGNAGIINLIYKKNEQEGFNGKVGLSSGLGALWERKENLPTINSQYQMTPKINPTLSLNYRKNKINAYVQADYLYTETLNKNEFVTRIYDDRTVVNQQSKRNRDTHFTTIKTGIDWNFNEHNTFAFSGLFGSEKIIDNGQQPIFNEDYTERLRLWEFLEDELKTTAMLSASYEHKFKQAGRKLNAGINYTYHREDEKYFFGNTTPTFTGDDAFKLLSDEKVFDLNLDYVQPLKYGRFEVGFKFRNRIIPTNMQFFPGENSIIDADAGGWATYKENIPALYSNYIFESNKIEAELGIRFEYIDLQYDVNPNHPTYKSDGYKYTEPFPNLRFGYKINDNNKLTAFYNRRVDRPNEVDIRIFPKYDDAEIIKVGNPGLRPQFTNSVEIGYKKTMEKGYFTSSFYYKIIDGTISRIATTVPGSNLIYNVFQNAGKSNSVGVEMIYATTINSWYNINLNGNVYQNSIDAFQVTNLYPEPVIYFGESQQVISGNLKGNNNFQFSETLKGQVTLIYLAPDIIPQGKIDARFSVDLGIRKTVQKGKGEVFLNATDVFNTLVIQTEIQGNNFSYQSANYFETQVIRFGYSYKF